MRASLTLLRALLVAREGHQLELMQAGGKPLLGDQEGWGVLDMPPAHSFPLSMHVPWSQVACLSEVAILSYNLTPS